VTEPNPGFDQTQPPVPGQQASASSPGFSPAEYYGQTGYAAPQPDYLAPGTSLPGYDQPGNGAPDARDLWAQPGNPYGQQVAPRDSAPLDYGYPPNPGYAVVPDHPQSTPVLVFGIIGLFLFPPMAVAALVMGNRARRDVRERPDAYRDSGNLTAGWVMGIIGTALLSIYAMFILVFFVALVAIA